jgi:hypothetical protein
VLEFRKLLGYQAPTTKAIRRNLTNVLRLYKEVLKYYKEYEEKKESDKEIEMKTPNTIPGNKGMQVFTVLPVKSSFTMSNILIDKTVVQDLILGDKKVILVGPCRVAQNSQETFQGGHHVCSKTVF